MRIDLTIDNEQRIKKACDVIKTQIINTEELADLTTEQLNIISNIVYSEMNAKFGEMKIQAVER